MKLDLYQYFARLYRSSRTLVWYLYLYDMKIILRIGENSRLNSGLILFD